MSTLFDQFIGRPIDWENPMNVAQVFQITTYTPEQMIADLRASSIDPNDLVTVGDLLVQSFSSPAHAKVAWEEAVQRFEANPGLVAADVNLLNLKLNLCRACLRSAPPDPLASFQWITREPKIARTDPLLAVQVAFSLQQADKYNEAEAVLQMLDGVPVETIAALSPEAPKVESAVRELKVAVRGTLCKRTLRSDPLASYGWILKEPGIVQADPKLALGIVSFLTRMDRFEEAAVVFAQIDQMSDRAILNALEGSPLGIEGLGCMRVELHKRTRFKSLPPRWDMESGPFEQPAAIVEDGLQRRVGLGQADTLVNLSLLAVSGDRRAIPLFVRALSHHKRDIQIEGALGLHLHGDQRGLKWLLSQDPNDVVGALRLIRDPAAASRVADWEKARVPQLKAAASSSSSGASGGEKGEKKGFLRSLFGG